MENETETAPRLSAGYAEAVVTPPMGMRLVGGYAKKYARGITSDVHIRCAAFQCGEKKAVFFSCECIGMKVNAYEILRDRIAERCQMDPAGVYITCSHVHTSFRIVGPDAEAELYQIHMRRLYQQFCDTAQFAFEDLKPARLYTARGEVKDISFLRRYRMKDGTVKTNPSIGSDEIEAFEGKADDSLLLLRVKREEGNEILLVNFGTHADVIGGDLVSSDFPGYLVHDLKNALDGKAEVLFLNGCEGDSNHINAFLPKGTPRKGHPIAQRMARKITAEVLRLYDDVKEISSDEIDSEKVNVKIGKNDYDPADVPIAEKIRAIYHEKGNKAPELKEFKLSLPGALRILENLKRPEFFDIELHFIRIGEAAFVGFPGEPFQELGLKIKEKSPYPVTVLTACTNGGQGYFPTEEAFEGGGYESSVSPFAKNCGPLLVEGALQGLERLKERETKGETNGNN